MDQTFWTMRSGRRLRRLKPKTKFKYKSENLFINEARDLGDAQKSTFPLILFNHFLLNVALAHLTVGRGKLSRNAAEARGEEGVGCQVDRLTRRVSK